MENINVPIKPPTLAKQILFSTEIQIPSQYSRAQNTNHRGLVIPIGDKQFKYGTAGFRSNDDFMPFIAYRTAVFAGYRARQLGKTIGIMITASHNPCADNGIKLVDPMGEMLDVTLEDRLTELINMSDEEFVEAIRGLEKATTKPIPNIYVHIGWDTRPSSQLLSLAASNAIEQTGVEFVANGLVTTPQLHYKVRATNDSTYGPVSSFTQRFTDAVDLFYSLTPRVNKEYSPKLYVDCANGVGAFWVGIYACKLSHPIIEVEMVNFNTNSHEELNRSCGADFVKIQNQMPASFENVPNGSRCCSLDGDADRLVYYYHNNNEFRILDGDHIAALFTSFVLDHLRELKLAEKFTFGVIQTAYANGNSTRFFKEQLKCDVKCVKTGTKYLQLAAREFDLAVHFEANGHGTVAMSEHFRTYLDQAHAENESDNVLGRFYAFCGIINECVGDGIADMLAVEQILRYYDWSIEIWEQKTYQNAHNVQLKIPVQNRDLYKTADDSETILIEPKGIQEKIDKIVSKHENARAFVRPSGTENILRVYSEAQTLSEAASIADEVRNCCIDT